MNEVLMNEVCMAHRSRPVHSYSAAAPLPLHFGSGETRWRQPDHQLDVCDEAQTSDQSWSLCKSCLDALAKVVKPVSREVETVA